MLRSSVLILIGLSFGLVGCVSGRGAPRIAYARATAGVAPSPVATGVWDWIFRSTDQQGDERIEQEEWHLSQHGQRIEGYYDRAVTMMSVDERLFRCNQRLGFTKMTRVRVAGLLTGDRITLREIDFQARPGPCDDGSRNLVAYTGVLHGSTLALNWAPDAGQTLVRRTDGGHLQLAELAGPGAPPDDSVTPASSGAAAGAPLSGTWSWELRSIDANGDERVEHESWHLTESPDGVTGYYERSVDRIRAEGTFACDGQPRYRTTTRYDVAGQRFGDKVTLSETDFHATPSPCDNALRRLDTYQGHVADPDTLILSWGPGNQLLHRVQSTAR